MKKNTSYKDIIDNFIYSAIKPFSIDAALDEIESKLNKNHRYSIDKIMDHFYKSDLLFFEMDDDGDNIFYPRQSFFKGAKFRVVPTPIEIEKGILYPGHRFQPFCSIDVFPADAHLKFRNKKLLTRPIESKLSDVYVYHSLLGMEEFSNYAITDNEENSEIFFSDDENGCLSLTVFDVFDIYKETEFQQGDALIFTVKDWLNGIYEVSYSSIIERENEFQETKEWCECFQAGLEEGFDVLGPTASINEQLAWAFFYGEDELLTTPAIHIGGFLNWCKEVSIKAVGIRSILWWHDQNPQDELYFGELQDKMHFTGCTDSLDSILEDIGVSLCQIEIEAYMCDEIYRGGDGYDVVIDRCFKSRTIEFYDDEQEKMFYKFIKKLWGSTKKTYNPFKDQQIGKIRSKILSILDKQLNWLRTLDQKNFQPDDLPSDQMVALAEASGLMKQLLSALAMEGECDDIDHQDQLHNIIDEVNDSVDMIIEQMNQTL